MLLPPSPSSGGLKVCLDPCLPVLSSDLNPVDLNIHGYRQNKLRGITISAFSRMPLKQFRSGLIVMVLHAGHRPVARLVEVNLTKP